MIKGDDKKRGNWKIHIVVELVREKQRNTRYKYKNSKRLYWETNTTTLSTIATL